VILDANEHVGDNWRNAWDSMRLFTPARVNCLPGMAFPLGPNEFATRDEMAAYLRAYAERFELPVRNGMTVDSLQPMTDGSDGYVVAAGGCQFEATNVVVATGPQHLPRVPDFAGDLDPGITQLHSSAYRNPGQFRPGPVLVVGASHSGPTSPSRRQRAIRRSCPAPSAARSRSTSEAVRRGPSCASCGSSRTMS